MARIRTEFGAEMKVIATGGLAGLFAGATDAIEHVDRDLTMAGLVELFYADRPANRTEGGGCRTELLFVPLGGAGEIGLNLNLYRLTTSGSWSTWDSASPTRPCPGSRSSCPIRASSPSAARTCAAWS